MHQSYRINFRVRNFPPTDQKEILQLFSFPLISYPKEVTLNAIRLTSFSGAITRNRSINLHRSREPCRNIPSRRSREISVETIRPRFVQSSSFINFWKRDTSIDSVRQEACNPGKKLGDEAG